MSKVQDTINYVASKTDEDLRRAEDEIQKAADDQTDPTTGEQNQDEQEKAKEAIDTLEKERKYGPTS